MFRTIPSFIIRSISLYTQQWYMSYRFADSLRAASKLSAKLYDIHNADSLVSANLYDIYRCCVYSKKLLILDGGTVRNM